MRKHTPGPWEMLLSDNATPFILHGKDAHLYDIDDLDRLVCVMPAEIMKDFNSFANARLIAAAPDLLEACKKLITGWQSDTDTLQVAIDAARAAIAKAEGGVKQ